MASTNRKDDYAAPRHLIQLMGWSDHAGGRDVRWNDASSITT